MNLTGEKINIARQDTVEEILNIIKTQPVYGFIEHNSILAPGSRIEYIGANAKYNPISITKGGGYSLGDWVDFPWLKANKPYMVNADGTPAYRLDENDYTKREDSSASDVSSTSFNGGAFSWAMKIYKREYMAGDDRYVMFRFDKADGFEAVGFIDPDNKELEGAWIPMFYGSIVDTKMRSTAGLQPCYSNATAAERTAIQAFSTRAHHFGGPLVETLIDLMIMFAKTTDTQGFYGNGNMSGYDASLTPTMGVKQNAVIGGGQFYGTTDGKSLNKIFHSIVLGSWQQWMRDPYELVVNGHVKVSKNYTYDLTGEKYIDTGIKVPDNMTWDSNHNANAYPSFYQTVQGYGAVPGGQMKGGSSATGGCDNLWRHDPKETFTAVALRFGYCSDGLAGGARARGWSNAATSASWRFGAANLLLPPVGVAV